MSLDKEGLIKRRDELVARLEAVKLDYQQGLDADSEERAVQLENAEVLESIVKATAEELEQVAKQLRDIG